MPYSNPINKNDKYERDNFGFSLLPVFPLSRIVSAFSASTWLGRYVYVMSHLFGDVPHFQVVIAIAKHIILGASPTANVKTKQEGNDKEEEDEVSHNEKFDWGKPLEEQDEPYADRCKDDFAFARLLQEEADLEEAKKLQDDPERAKRLIDPDFLSHDADFLLAMKMQEEIYREHDFKNPFTVIPPGDPKDLSQPPSPHIKKDETTIKVDKKFDKPIFDIEDQEATYQILSTPGLEAIVVKDDANDQAPIERMELIREALRGQAASIGKERPQALSPAALKAQRNVDLEQYIAFELKRFGHVQEIKGFVPLPSGKQLKLEGFFDVFTAPMVMSSFKQFAESTNMFMDEMKRILTHFTSIMYCDYISRKDVTDIVAVMQAPDFTGPLIISHGFDIHCAVTIFYRGFLIYCDRGSDKIEHGIYVMRTPNPELITEDFLWEGIKKEDIKEKDYDIIAKLVSELNAEVVYHDQMPSQNVGNCSYATMEALLKALMAIDNIEQAFEKTKSKTLGASDWLAAFRHIHPKFETWVDFDKKMVFDEFVEEVQEWLSDKGDFGKQNLKKTYQEALTYWRYGSSLFYDPIQIQKVDALLKELA